MFAFNVEIIIIIMVERITTETDMLNYIDERKHTARLRDAIGFCKNTLDIKAVSDRNISEEERLGFEKCLTQNYLIIHGQDYFGKRDLIYIDLYGRDDLRALMSSI